jgi:hypothetical protein
LDIAHAALLRVAERDGIRKIFTVDRAAISQSIAYTAASVPSFLPDCQDRRLPMQSVFLD